MGNGSCKEKKKIVLATIKKKKKVKKSVIEKLKR
jgi:hypothetical protein